MASIAVDVHQAGVSGRAAANQQGLVSRALSSNSQKDRWVEVHAVQAWGAVQQDLWVPPLAGYAGYEQPGGREAARACWSNCRNAVSHVCCSCADLSRCEVTRQPAEVQEQPAQGKQHVSHSCCSGMSVIAALAHSSCFSACRRLLAAVAGYI